jgi:hypothetical protein
VFLDGFITVKKGLVYSVLWHLEGNLEELLNSKLRLSVVLIRCQRLLEKVSVYLEPAFTGR